MADRKDRIADASVSESSALLLRLAREGDQSALDRLFRRHLPRLHRWARGQLPSWVRDAVDTADIVQETVLHVFRRLDVFEARRAGALQAYLRQAVTNRIRDEFRRAGRRPPAASLSDTHPDSGCPSPLDYAIGREALARYRVALTRLNPEEQHAVVGRLEFGYSYDQLALMLRKPSPDSARMTVNRALARLAAEMDSAR